MDATVFVEGNGFYRVVAAPSMRGLADLTTALDRTVTIDPDEGSDLEGIHTGPYRTVDEAMVAIGAHLGGRCRYAPRRGYP